MRQFELIPSVRDIRLEFARIPPDEQGMREIVGCQFLADEPAIFGTPNEDWHARELQWYESMSRDIRDIPPPVPKLWRDVACVDGRINSNYGWCIWSEDNGFQYASCIDAIRRDRYTRQAVMIYTRPSMHKDAKTRGRKDFMCTNAVQFLVRPHPHESGQDEIHCIVQMRSSDAVFGYKGDWAWHRHVLNMIAADVKAKPGKIIWNAGSFHVYPRHEHLVEEFVDREQAEIRNRRQGVWTLRAE